MLFVALVHVRLFSLLVVCLEAPAGITKKHFIVMDTSNDSETSSGGNLIKDVSHSSNGFYPIPAFRRAALTSRTSSHSSLQSAHHLHYANEVENHGSRPGTPLSVLAPDYSGELGVATSPWTARHHGSGHVLQHLYKHASSFGLDTSSINPERGCKTVVDSTIHKKIDVLPQEMSQTDDCNMQQTPAFLSWRKLHLSRAKLKAASNTSALLAGFAMVAVVELQLEGKGDEKLPTGLLICFAICTTFLVAVHMLALLISTCILPNMDAISNLHSLSLVQESPHEKMQMYIELAWGCSTVVGILLFMIEIIILCWIQFYHVLKEAAYVATAILLPFVALFVWFAFIFYRKLVSHTYETRKSGIQELERLKHGLEMGDMDLMVGQKSETLDHIV